MCVCVCVCVHGIIFHAPILQCTGVYHRSVKNCATHINAAHLSRIIGWGMATLRDGEYIQISHILSG